MRRLILPLAILILLTGWFMPASASTIHTHFFEAIDVNLNTDNLQIMSVAMLEGEELTVVAYGVTNNVSPQLTLLDPLGSTVAEDFNSDGNEVAFVQHTTTTAGVYTFIISRQRDPGGFVRVMVFEGEPLEPDATYIDTLDPFAPARAFMIDSDPLDPVSVTVDLIEPENEDVFLPEVFAYQSTTDELAPLEERTDPIPPMETVSWLNAEELPFYTLNVRPFPELQSTARRIGGLTRALMQSWEIFDYLIILGGGNQPEAIDREYCLTASGQEVVGIAENGNYIVIDPNNNYGIGLVPSDQLIIDVTSPDCDRVVPMDVHPDLIAPPTATTGTGGGSTGGGGTGFIPPADDPPPVGSGGNVINPPTGGGSSGGGSPQPTTTPLPTITPQPTFTVSWECIYDPATTSGYWYYLRATFDNLPAGATLFVLDSMGIAHSGTGSGNVREFYYSEVGLYAGTNYSFAWKVSDALGNPSYDGTATVACPATPF